MREFNYEIVEDAGDLNSDPYNLKKVQLIRYNGAAAKVDIRARRGEKMLKGIALSIEEAKKLRAILNGMEL